MFPFTRASHVGVALFLTHSRVQVQSAMLEAETQARPWQASCRIPEPETRQAVDKANASAGGSRELGYCMPLAFCFRDLAACFVWLGDGHCGFAFASEDGLLAPFLPYWLVMVSNVSFDRHSDFWLQNMLWLNQAAQFRETRLGSNMAGEAKES